MTTEAEEFKKQENRLEELRERFKKIWGREIHLSHGIFYIDTECEDCGSMILIDDVKFPNNIRQSEALRALNEFDKMHRKHQLPEKN